MTPKAPARDGQLLLDPSQIDLLIHVLLRRDYEVIGPTVRDGAIVYDRLSSMDDLPKGTTDEQEGGKYRLKARNDSALFGYAAGPHSWKKFLFPAIAQLWRAQRTDGHFQILPLDAKSPQFAFLGVRACELHAIAIQDRVFLEGPYVDPNYESRRKGIFLVAVDCTKAGGTCFCDSMSTGPKVDSGYDISLTEVLQEDQHFFVARCGTKKGAEILAEIPAKPASKTEVALADAAVEECARHMGRSLETNGLKELLYRNTENPRWDSVVARCLSCANCTTVCPTCFCSTVEDLTDLTGQEAVRVRKWDSCFVTDFSYIHGGSVRATIRSKFRQWMMHKLAYWIDQFGTSGCVGCGRCITWCPVGIDITEEARAFRDAESSVNASV